MHIGDESWIDPDSISFSVASGPAIGIDDPRLTYSDGVLTYTPVADEYYGDYGETVTASLSVSDTLGNRLQDYTWSFKLELETILADNVVLVHEKSPLTLISVKGDEYLFSYSGDSPGISVGDILVSADRANPYKRKAVNVAVHPESHTVDVLTEPATLPEIFAQGSIRAAYGSPEEPGAAPLRREAPATLQMRERIPLDGAIIYQTGNVTVQVVSGFIDYVADFNLAAEFTLSTLKTFDADVGAAVNFDAVVRGTVHAQGTCEKAKTLKTVRRFCLQFIRIPVFPYFIPVWEEVVLEFNIGFTLKGEAEGWVQAGFRSWNKVTVGPRLRDGNWSNLPTWVGDFAAVTPDWQTNGGAGLQVYVEPKLTVYLESLGGPSLNLKPYLELSGCFQMNPPAYDWGLYAGLSSDLALELRAWQEEWGDLPQWELLDVKKTLLEANFPRPWLKSIGVEWATAFGDESFLLYPAEVQQTSDGGYVLGGGVSFHRSTGQWESDACVLKTDAYGNEEWKTTLGGEGAQGGLRCSKHLMAGTL